MKKVAFLLIIISLLTGAYQCIEREEDCFVDYYLQFEPKFYPERDTFRLNDTIWFEMNVGDSLFDVYSQKWVPRKHKTIFPLYLSMAKLEATRHLHAEDMFDFISAIGRLKFERLSQFTIIKIEMDNNLSGNHAKLAFIPKRLGIFEVTPYILSDDLVNLPVGDNHRCRSIVKEASFKTNSHLNTDNGYHLIRDSGSPAYQNYTKENHKREGTFAFIVVD